MLILRKLFNFFSTFTNVVRIHLSYLFNCRILIAIIAFYTYNKKNKLNKEEYILEIIIF